MTKKAMKDQAEEVIVLLRQMFGTGIEFACIDCHKTNEALTGISMRLPGCSSVPVVYMEDMPADASAAEIANIAAAAYQEAMRELGKGELPSLPDLDREYILDNVVLQVISRKRNRQLLKAHPCFTCLDFAGVFRIPIGKYAKNSLQSVLISNEIIREFELSTFKLAEAARENTLKKFGVTFTSASEMFALFAKGKFVPFEETSMDQPGMYVLTNEIQINGAALMLIPTILDQIAEKAGGNFYILPTSIHEIMIVKDDSTLTPKELKAIVYKGNRTPGIVASTDILSDNVYRYCRHEKALQIAK